MNSKFNSLLAYFKRIDRYDTIAIILSSIFFIIFSIFSLKQYFSLGDSAFDLGVSANILYSFIHGHFFYSNLLGYNLLYEHFSPFEFLLVPIYFIYQSPIVLLIFENIFISFSGFILYKIIKNFFEDKIDSKFYLSLIGISFLLLYEMSPYTQSLVSFPFHKLAILPFFFFLAIYSFLNEKRLLHYFSLIIIISLHANFIYIVAIILLYELFFLRTKKGYNIKIWLSKKYEAHKNINIIYFIIFILALYSYFIFAGFIKNALDGIYLFSYAPSTEEVGSVSSSPIGLIIALFTDPHIFFKSILAVYGEKKFFVSFAIRSSSYFAIFSPLSLIMTLPYMVYAIPSAYPSYYQLGYQYGAMLIAPLFISAVIGLYNIFRLIDFVKDKKIFNKLKKYKKLNIRILTIISIFIIILSITMLPYGVLSPANIAKRPAGSEIVNINDYNNTGGASYLINFSDSINRNATILTQNNLMPYFSNHYNIYMAPDYVINLSLFQYIIVQNNSLWANIGNPTLNQVAQRDLSNGSYHIISENKANDIYILEKDN